VSYLRNAVQAAPQIPARDAAVRVPTRRDAYHLRGIGQRIETVSLLHRASYSQITYRHHVRPGERENEEHLRGPNAHTSHLRKYLDDFGVCELLKFSELDLPARYPFRQIGKRGDFLAGQAAGAQPFCGQFQKPGGGESSSHSSLESRKDGCRSLTMQLLERDRSRQRLESGITRRHRARSDLLDYSCEYRVGRSKV